MSDATPENPQIPPPPPPSPAWQSPFSSPESPGPDPAEPAASYPLTAPGATPAGHSRLRTAAAVTAGAVALGLGAFFIGHATGGGGGTPTQGISAADAVNATAAAGSSPTAQCTIPNAAVGTLKSVNGGTLTITDRSGKDVTVTTSTDTTIVKIETGTVADVTTGQMIVAHGTSTGQNPISADNLAIIPSGVSQSSPALGKLRQPAARFGQPVGLAFGTVKSVSGNTIVVQEPDGTSVTVTTTSSTKVQKAVTIQAKDLTVGQPVAATGAAGTNGSIAAKYVVQGNGDPGFKGFGLGGLGVPGPGHIARGGWGDRDKAPQAPSPAAPPAAG